MSQLKDVLEGADQSELNQNIYILPAKLIFDLTRFKTFINDKIRHLCHLFLITFQNNLNGISHMLMTSVMFVLWVALAGHISMFSFPTPSSHKILVFDFRANGLLVVCNLGN